MKKVLTWALASLLLATISVSAQPAPVVTVSSGAIRGTAQPDGGAVFRGIPYAAAPVEALRWMPPTPAPRWEGVRDATSFGHPCVQSDQKWNSEWAAIGVEDCLYLNVWTPAHARHLPVMVWIHGGGFSGGAGDAADADGARLAAHGVIIVSINYRLGVLGFFAHPGVAPATGGNFGLLDQLAALRWVKANIARFRGDARNVTIFGQSAGGIAIQALLASPLTAGLAHKAIIESGVVVPLLPTLRLATAADSATRFAAGQTLEQLRQVSAEDILKRYIAFTPQIPTDAQDQFFPYVDGALLPDDPQAIFAQGREQKLPLIIGNNGREGFLIKPMNDAALTETLRNTYGDKADAAMHAYGLDAPQPPDPVLGSAAMAWATDTIFRCGAARTARRHAATGAPVYEYQFEQPLPGHEAQGALHGNEIPYVFGNLLPGGHMGGAFTPADRALSDVMMGYWSNFAKTGDPNGAGLPAWPRFDGAGRGFVGFANRFPGGVMADTGLRREACDLYEASPAFREW